MPSFVSRGGHKLDAALNAFGIDVAGKRALDAGASTGGFTDCLLQRGAASVVAVDVAYGQFAWTLRNDARVELHERTNVRAFVADPPVDVVVADLSFVSLSSLAEALAAAPDLVLMVKPQFELPRARVPRGGVVTGRTEWADAMRAVAGAYRARGYVLRAAAPSPITGPKGNREFFVWLSAAPGGASDAGDEVIERAIEAAP
jgi:23S rRNA (cytidine1920-2'-O)/16S rRNA (cytidine1409-2'-O)-methyltransferase